MPTTPPARPDPHRNLGRSDDLLGGTARLASSETAPAEDRIELWGRRIGRGLAVVVAIGIVVGFLLGR